MTAALRIFTAFMLAAALWPLAAPAAEQDGKNSPTPPDVVARQTVETLLDEMKGRRDELRRNPQKLDALVERVLVPLVDINYMSQLVLGRYWRTATPEQRERFADAFKNMLIHTYGTALLQFQRDSIKFEPLRAAKGADDVTFRATVLTESGDKVPVDLNLHLVDGQWKVYNGSVGNLTFVTNYRGQFNQEIRRTSLETLIEKLEKRYGGAEKAQEAQGTAERGEGLD